MKTETRTTAQLWSDDELAALRNRLRESRRVLAAFPAGLPSASLLRRLPPPADAKPGEIAVEALPLPREGRVVVGRKGDVPFAFPEDAALSNPHFQIVVDGGTGRCRAEALKASNGLWINGRKVTERWLVHGDQIHAGSQDFVFHDGTTAGWGDWVE